MSAKYLKATLAFFAANLTGAMLVVASEQTEGFSLLSVLGGFVLMCSAMAAADRKGY